MVPPPAMRPREARLVPSDDAWPGHGGFARERAAEVLAAEPCVRRAVEDGWEDLRGWRVPVNPRRPQLLHEEVARAVALEGSFALRRVAQRVTRVAREHPCRARARCAIVVEAAARSVPGHELDVAIVGRERAEQDIGSLRSAAKGNEEAQVALHRCGFGGEWDLASVTEQEEARCAKRVVGAGRLGKEREYFACGSRKAGLQQEGRREGVAQLRRRLLGGQGA